MDNGKKYLEASNLINKAHDRFKNKFEPKNLIDLYEKELLSKNISKLYKYLYIDFDTQNEEQSKTNLNKFNHLCNAGLILSYYSDFNDPLDTYGMQIIEREIQDNENYKDTKEKTLGGFKTIYTTCFTLNPPKKLNSILMWSHYARSHKGICIEYDMQDIINLMKQNGTSCFDSTPPLCLALLPVSYISSFDHVLNDVGNNGVINIFEKLNPWEYENEWRITSNYPIIDLPLQKLYFGTKIPDSHKERFLKVFENTEQVYIGDFLVDAIP